MCIFFSSQFPKLICAVQGHQTRHGDASLRRHERKRRMTRTRTSNGNSWSLLMYKNLLRRTWQPGSRHSKVLFACAWHECDADVDDFCRWNIQGGLRSHVGCGFLQANFRTTWASGHALRYSICNPDCNCSPNNCMCSQAMARFKATKK